MSGISAGASGSSGLPSGADAGRRGSITRQGWPAGASAGQREREHSVGAQSAASSSATPGTLPGASVSRTASRRTGGRTHNRSGLGASSFGTNAGSTAGTPGPRRKKDKHTRALLSIREFLRGRSCYDCLPVSFRLVVLDTKLVVRPAIEVMWQTGVVSAPLWQSTTEPGPIESTNRTDDAASLAESAQAPSSLEEGNSVTSPLDAASSNEQSHHSSDLSDVVSPSSGAQAMTSRSLSPRADLNAAQTARNESPLPSSLQSESAMPRKQRQGSQQRSVAPPPGQAGFAGMLTVNDIIHLIQYYYKHSSYDNAAQDVECFRLEMLRDIEHALNVPEPPLLSIEPLRPLFDACQLLIKTHARRLPLLDRDAQTGMDTVVSVLSQYRVLKFIAMNCRETTYLSRSIKSLGIGTYAVNARKSSNDWPRLSMASSTLLSSRRSSNTAHTLSPFIPQAAAEKSDKTVPESVPDSALLSSPLTSTAGESGSDNRAGARGNAMYGPLATASLDTTVFDVVHIFSELGISAVPVLDEDGFVVDMYETVDVIDLVRSNAYQSLDLTIRQALSRRPKDFPGIMTCSPDDSLATIFSLLRTHRVHRLVILEPEVATGLEASDSLTSAEQKVAAAEAKTEEHLLSGNMSAAATAAASAEQARQQSQQQKMMSHEQFGGQIRTRPRGRLAGILCLSDIMKYIIGSSTEQLLNATTSVSQIRRGSASQGPLGTTLSGIASTTSSSIQDPSLLGSLGLGHRGSVSGTSSAAVSASGDSGDAAAPGSDGEDGSNSAPTSGPHTGSSVVPAAARFDPNDVPPTIQEQPTVEAASTPNAETLVPAVSKLEIADEGSSPSSTSTPAQVEDDTLPRQVADVYIPSDTDQTPTQEEAPMK